MNDRVMFDLYLFDAATHVRDRRRITSLQGRELPRAGDLIELNEFSKVMHQKYEVVQVHRFFSSAAEFDRPRVYVKELEA